MNDATITERSCRECGCTDADCEQCIARTSWPCFWVEAGLCSSCALASKKNGLVGFREKLTLPDEEPDYDFYAEAELDATWWVLLVIAVALAALLVLLIKAI